MGALGRSCIVHRPMEAPTLEAVRVTKRFANGVVALADVELAVAATETVALIGESGSGKTTLLRLFNRLIEPTSGSVRVQGHDARSLDPIALRRQTGYVQQDGGLLPHWSIERNVELVPRLAGWTPQARRERVADLLTLVGLAPEIFRKRYPAELSGGQRQRVAVARALAADPDVILLDEPFGALDALTRFEMQDEFLRLKEQVGKTMVLVTHDLDEALKLGDRVAVLRQGEVVQCATPDEILEAPASDYVRQLLDHVRGPR